MRLSPLPPVLVRLNAQKRISTSSADILSLSLIFLSAGVAENLSSRKPYPINCLVMAFPRRCRSVDELLWLIHTIRKSMEPQKNRSLNNGREKQNGREPRNTPRSGRGRAEAPDGFQEEGLPPSLSARLPQLRRGRRANQTQVARPPASSQQLSGHTRRRRRRRSPSGEDGVVKRSGRS